MRVEVHRALSRHDEKLAQLVFEFVLPSPASSGAPQVERLARVMHEDLCVVGNAVTCDAFDPRRRCEVLRRPRSPGELLVRDVANERVPERQLLLSFHRRRPRWSDQLLADELAHTLFHGTLVDAADRSDCAGPEHLAQDRRILQQ